MGDERTVEVLQSGKDCLDVLMILKFICARRSHRIATESKLSEPNPRDALEIRDGCNLVVGYREVLDGRAQRGQVAKGRQASDAVVVEADACDLGKVFVHDVQHLPR